MRNRILWCLLCIAVAVPAQAGFRSDPTTLDGDINPEFQGKSYQTYVVGAVNAIQQFRKYLETWHVSRINHAAQNKQAGREFRVLFPDPLYTPNKSYTIEEIKKRLADEGIQIFVFINVKDKGGYNLTDVDTMDKALLAAANSLHDSNRVEHYGGTDVVLYELSSGKVVWRGNGIVKAKPNTPKWFKRTSVGHAKFLEKRLRSAKLLSPEGKVQTVKDEPRNESTDDAKPEPDEKLADPKDDGKKGADI